MNLLAVILIVILIFSIIGGIPVWPHSANWGFGPSASLGTILIIVLILLLIGKL